MSGGLIIAQRIQSVRHQLSRMFAVSSQSSAQLHQVSPNSVHSSWLQDVLQFVDVMSNLSYAETNRPIVLQRGFPYRVIQVIQVKGVLSSFVFAGEVDRVGDDTGLRDLCWMSRVAVLLKM